MRIACAGRTLARAGSTEQQYLLIKRHFKGNIAPVCHAQTKRSALLMGSWAGYAAMRGRSHWPGSPGLHNEPGSYKTLHQTPTNRASHPFKHFPRSSFEWAASVGGPNTPEKLRSAT